MSFWARVWLPWVLAGAACLGSKPPGPARSYAHPNGLVLALPPRLDGKRVSVEQTRTGFDIALDREELVRFQESATIELVAEGQAPGTAAARQVRGVPVRYAIEEDEGGSGGQLYTLTAWEPCGGGVIVYRQSAQAEAPARPDFALLWSVVNGTDARTRGACRGP